MKIPRLGQSLGILVLLQLLLLFLSQNECRNVGYRRNEAGDFQKTVRLSFFGFANDIERFGYDRTVQNSEDETENEADAGTDKHDGNAC